jgi:serine/threonine-protein phosphatase 2B catalytic subunit
MWFYREESESVSELKNVTGSTKLPAGALANGAEGIKESITNFTDARKSDIDNEHLPPDLIDPADMELSSSGDDASFEEANGGTSTAPSSPTRGSASPGSPGGEEGARFKKGHGRQSSLGTTMTSPSTRRRSLENTFSMIREAMNKDDSSIGSSPPLSPPPILTME